MKKYLIVIYLIQKMQIYNNEMLNNNKVLTNDYDKLYNEFKNTNNEE